MSKQPAKPSSVFLLCLSIVLVLVALLTVSVYLVFAQNKKQILEAQGFCESLVPKLEQVKQQTGAYPERLDPAWWAGTNVPKLISGQTFYFRAASNEFSFKFLNHTPFTLAEYEFYSPGYGWAK